MKNTILYYLGGFLGIVLSLLLCTVGVIAMVIGKIVCMINGEVGHKMQKGVWKYFDWIGEIFNCKE